VDLAQLVKAKRYRYALNLIEHLPPDSHYAQAISQDERVAAQIDLTAPPKPPPLTEYGPDIRVLAGIYNRLGALIAVSRAAAGDKNVHIPPGWPRPVLAAERLRRRQRLEKHEFLKRQLLPGS
jgi:hypothetical protein